MQNHVQNTCLKQVNQAMDHMSNMQHQNKEFSKL